MKKRSVTRIPVDEKIRILYGNMIYSGTILNLSEKGMFIGTKVYFSPYSIIRIESNSYILCARVKRLKENNEKPDGVGIELINLSREYLHYLSRLKTVL
jgi:hypothetical protein